MRHRELVLQLGVGLDEVDDDRARALVDDDALAQVAARGRLQAGRGPDDAVVEGAGGRARDGEDPLEGRGDVGDGHVLPVGELDSLAQGEGVGLAVVADLRQGLRQVGHHGERVLATHLLEGQQSVVQRLVELPVLQRVVDLGVEGPAGGLGQQLEVAALVLGLEGRRSGRVRASPAPPPVAVGPGDDELQAVTVSAIAVPTTTALCRRRELMRFLRVGMRSGAGRARRENC